MQFNFTPKKQEVKVPEWKPGNDEKLYVTELTGAEYVTFERYARLVMFGKGTDEECREAYAQIAVRYAKKADGTPFFLLSQLEILANGNSKPLRRIFEKLAEINNLDDETAKELEKNLPSTANAE